MTTLRKFFLPILLSFIALDAFVAQANAQDKFVVPELVTPVTDQAGILSSQTSQSLNVMLKSLYDSGGSQIGVLTLPSLYGSNIEDISIEIVDKWKLGRKGKDDGILLLIVPSERRLRIEVGRGREGDLTDAYSKRIISEVITPSFKNQDYDSGVRNGVLAIVSVTDPTFDLNQSGFSQVRLRNRQIRSEEGNAAGSVLRTALIVLFVLVIIFFKILNALGLGRGGRSSSWHSGGGGWGGGSSGGGGGWSGGGGGFGGGGSSGQW